MSPSLRLEELPPCTIANQQVRRFLLTSPLVRLELMEWGATVLSVVMDVDGQAPVEVSRGLASPESYGHNPAYMGAICGRYAGRIANARFQTAEVAGGAEIHLRANNGEHQLHGGEVGFDARLWSGEPFDSGDRVGVRFRYVSEDGEEGYPGALEVCVDYALDHAGRIWIDYEARALDQASVVNLTNHCYWNLAADTTVLNHELQLGAASVVRFDADLLPNGLSDSVANSALDFRRPRQIGAALAQLPEDADGFDHCLHDFGQELEAFDAPASLGAPAPLKVEGSVESIAQVAQVSDPASGRGLRVYTDQPALIFYTGNALDGSDAVGTHKRHSAFCLECQQFPDAPNQPNFPSPVVHPDRPYTQTTVYELFVASSRTAHQ